MNEYSVTLELKRINTKIFKKISERLREKKLAISPVQARILFTLHNSKNKLNQKDIENIINRNKSTTSSILDTMSKNNLIKKEIDKNDARKYNIILTKKALKIIKKLDEDRLENEKKIMENITEEELNNFKNFINKIENNLERM